MKGSLSKDFRSLEVLSGRGIMELNLSLKQSCLSVLTLPKVTLPRFTLVTGLNGSGKPHLPKAINDEAVRIEGVVGGAQHVRHFDWNTMAPPAGGEAPSRGSGVSPLQRKAPILARLRCGIRPA